MLVYLPVEGLPLLCYFRQDKPFNDLFLAALQLFSELLQHMPPQDIQYARLVVWLVLGHVVLQGVRDYQLEVLEDALWCVLVVASLQTAFVHFPKAHGFVDHVPVVEYFLIVRTNEILVLVEHGQCLNTLEDDFPFLDLPAEWAEVALLIIVPQAVPRLYVPIAILMYPLAAELPGTLRPLSIPLLLADMADFICLLSLVAIHALVPSRYQHEVV